ncbi:hypothetical protein BKA82DRAFT_1003728 [Pisolithus tinctorius]|nr:hypothetical protein BKA82DRAFT_1003728 [Pisolithus tinctorius]
MQPETLEFYDSVDLEISQATFDAVFQKLTELGALSLHQYLHDSDSSTGISSTTDLSLYPSASTLSLPTSPTKSSEHARHNAVSRLNEICQRVFGNTDPLRYEFLEENGPKSKQCILTIARHDGTKRSYTTQPIFQKKAEAKAEVSRIAIEMGALDFLMYGESEGQKEKRNSPTSSASDGPSGGGSSSTQAIDVIESCCIQWRAGRVVPRWIALTEPRLGLKHGCALQVKLSPHVDHVYMSEPTFDTYGEAKEACAAAAITEGVLRFIKHGDGQVRPPSPRQSRSPLLDEKNKQSDHLKLPLTLQNFFDSLPRPLPETFDTSNAYQINATAWLNTLIRNSKGSKFAMVSYYISGSTPGLHGCLLRIDRPGTYRAYLVDAEFAKRADAKAAVCLKAMSCGVGEYIRTIVSSVESKLTSQMRSFSNNYIHPTLQSELSKIDPGLYPHFEFEKERDAFGATLLVKLSASSIPEQSRKYMAPCEYGSKADAKAAVIALAAEQGVIEFVRFRGRPPPPGYCSPYKLQNYDGGTSRKRPQPDSRDDRETRPSKKQKRNVPRGSGKDPSGHEGTPGREHQDGGDSSYDQSYGVRRLDGASGAQEFGADWPFTGPGDVHEPGRPSGPPLHGVASSCHYGQLPFNDPLSLSIPFDSSPYVLGSTNDFLGPGLLNSIQPLVTHSLSPLFPVIPQHAIPLGHSNVPAPVLVNTAAMPITPARSADSALEPGEVRSSISPLCSQDVRSCIRSSGQGETSAKTLDPRRKTISKPTRTPDEATTVPSESKGEFKRTAGLQTATRTPTVSVGRTNNTGGKAETSHVEALTEYCIRNGHSKPSFHEEQEENNKFKVWIIIGKERFELLKMYESVEEGREHVAKKVLARLRSNGGGAERS